MFKKLPNLLLAAVAIVAFNFEVSAQSCTPDASNTTDGFTPAAPFTLPAGETGDAYDEVLQFRVPDSVKISRQQALNALPAALAPISGQLAAFLPDTLGAEVNEFSITGVNNLHDGFTFANSWCGGSATCTYSPMTNGCLNIFGTPTQPGNNDLTVATSVVVTVNIDTTISIPFVGSFGPIVNLPTGIPQVLDEGIYSLNVTGNPISAEQVEAITSVNIYPQPATNNIFVDFNANKSEVLNVEIYDLVGKRVYFETINIMEGFNHLQINSTDFTEGMYIYTVTDANRNQKFSNRIIISK